MNKRESLQNNITDQAGGIAGSCANATLAGSADLFPTLRQRPILVIRLRANVTGWCPGGRLSMKECRSQGRERQAGRRPSQRFRSRHPPARHRGPQTRPGCHRSSLSDRIFTDYGFVLADAATHQPCLNDKGPAIDAGPLSAMPRADQATRCFSRISSRVLQSMQSVAVGRASRRRRPISIPHCSQ